MSLFIRDESDEEDLVLELSRHEEDRSKQIDDASNGEMLYPLLPDDGDSHMRPNIEEIRPVDIQLSLPLPFQQMIVEDLLVSEDSLLILGKGLGIEPIVANLLHVLATPTRINGQDKRSLVLLLNASEEDNEKILEELLELAWSGTEEDGQRPFSVVTADLLTVDQRRRLYLHGGIVSVTSRILIVDLLSGIIHPNKITGLVILHVENLHNYSNESFIAEMYRSVNRWGFIKAVSDEPEAFMTEFSPLKRKLKDLRLKRTLLWPRFHVEVSSSLNVRNENKVIEVKVSLTNSMSQIQFGLFECLKKCIDELNRKNPTLSLESWNADNCLHPNFFRSLYSVLTPNWHRISFESKQLVKDIGTLKKLLHALVSYDAVDFYEIIQVILDANKPSVSRKYSESPWLMAEESQAVLSYAKKRVFSDGNYELEELPKWEQLTSILDDIAVEQAKLGSSLGPTLIMCSEDRTCRQLRKIIGYSNRKEGARRFMLNKLRAYMNRRDLLKKTAEDIQEESRKEGTSAELSVSRSFAKEEVASKRRRTRGAASVAAVTRLKRATSNGGEDIESVMSVDDIEQHISQIIEDTDEGLIGDQEIDNLAQNFDEDNELLLTEETNIDTSELEPMIKNENTWAYGQNNFEYIDRGDQIVIEKFYNRANDVLLQELLPSHIIMYEPDLAFIRRVEMFKALHKDWPLKVYFMYYGDSFEEQSHLIAIKKEKDAFTRLIREHSGLAQHFEADEDLSRYKNLAQRKLLLNQSLRNSRLAGGQKGYDAVTGDVVVVDMREFRAPLPGLLYRYGVKVIPCMLTIGDYILSPQICVERKSISDLIGSFKNGRLNDQCKKMSRYYEYPTLLIEFDDGDSFSLEPFSEKRYNSASSTSHPIGSKLMQDEIQMQLAQLIMKFPSLRILWSSSPLQTVNLILDLKLGREQPDPTTCVEIGVNRKSSGAKDKTNHSNEKFKELLSIPGLSNVDYYTIIRRVKRFTNLQKLSVDQITDLVNDKNLAERIWHYVQTENEEKDNDIMLEE
ncbi:ssDNA endodeoxyribonuclease RAD1 [Lachancea thermotolerans CBS 6340]|uniref:KLTH0E11000p n=1 Tax=Lachancea thermotolerans (strain ATCC 56472 / CBS 6340 / NRRL Y-8284) TaxID=559295 RepID=C5DIA6_LACTC|nr:KLTH0E11000p [Lachancea thermotolerans CBS 6340]CAR23517.1 KLTH0E11000p [Lachancea thermotolerans CBS 6340]